MPPQKQTFVLCMGIKCNNSGSITECPFVFASINDHAVAVGLKTCSARSSQFQVPDDERGGSGRGRHHRIEPIELLSPLRQFFGHAQRRSEGEKKTIHSKTICCLIHHIFVHY